MDQVRKVISLFVICSILFMVLPDRAAFAEPADGIYSVDYEIIHAETESASIANDYFEKPAILFVKDDEKFIRFTVNHSEWIKEIQTPLDGDYIDVEVKSEDAEEDMRDVVFKVEQEDLNEPILFKMHVVVDAVDPAIDSNYTARFNLKMDTLEEMTDSTYEESDLVVGKEEVEKETDKEASDENLENEEESTSNSSNSAILLMSILVIGVILVIILMKVFKKKK